MVNIYSIVFCFGGFVFWVFFKEQYWQAKWSLALAVAETKTWVWEEFSETMDQDHQMALKQFWQNVKRLRRGMPSSSNTLYSPAGVLLTSTEDTFGWLKEYLEHTFSPTFLCRKSRVGECRGKLLIHHWE